jgi:hypothetical protein
MKTILDKDILRVVRDKVYEHNEYEVLKVLRGEVEIGTEDPKQFIEKELLKV